MLAIALANKLTFTIAGLSWRFRQLWQRSRSSGRGRGRGIYRAPSTRSILEHADQAAYRSLERHQCGHSGRPVNIYTTLPAGRSIILRNPTPQLAVGGISRLETQAAAIAFVTLWIVLMMCWAEKAVGDSSRVPSAMAKW